MTDELSLIQFNNYDEPLSLESHPKSFLAASSAGKTMFNLSAIPFVCSTASGQRSSGSTPTIGTNTLSENKMITHAALQNSKHSIQIAAPVPHVPPIPNMAHQIDYRTIDPRVWRGNPYTPSANQCNARMFSAFDENIYRVPTMPTPLINIPLLDYTRSNRDAVDSSRSCGPIALPNGTIMLLLREGIRVDLTLDKAVRVVNSHSQVAISLSSTMSSGALIHPNGRVFQHAARVEICVYDAKKTNSYVRYAKMWYKGVSFTSNNCALVYLVDTAGTRTTTDTFTRMDSDYTISVFYNDSRHGSVYADEAMLVLQKSTYKMLETGAEVYDINGCQITQMADGLLTISRNNQKCVIRTSPSNGSATLTTPYMHCTASLGQTSHLFVRRGERRMHFDGAAFVVRNVGHSAGFDENNLLKVY